MHTAHRHLLMRLITPKGLKENEDFMWQYADRLLDGFVDSGSCELVQRLRRAVHPHRDRRPRGRAGGGPRAVPRPAVHRPRADGAQAARVPLRALQRVHRGATAEPARRHPLGPRHRVVPRRLHAGGEGRRPARRQPLRRGPGDHRADDLLRAADARRATRPPGQGARGPRPDPHLHRGDAAAREPAAHPVPDDPRPHRARRRRHPGRRHGDAGPRRLQPRPARVRATRTSSTSAAPTPASTSPSATASTPAPAPRSPAPRAASPSTASSIARATSRSPSPSTAPPTPAATTTSRPSSCEASSSSTSS